MAASPFDIELDELTLAQARRGRLPACERIYRLYASPSYTVALRICQCPATAEEVTQEAFITAFRKLRQFRGDAPFWGWLRRVVANHAISALRRRPPAEVIELQEFHARTDPAQEQVGLAMDLSRALSNLDAEDRAVVWLHDVEGYGHGEIASLFGRTESFSKSRLSRARAKLRALLAGNGAPPQQNAAGGCETT
jgi:RNA polymerase sigma factor (sigma-70 family)